MHIYSVFKSFLIKVQPDMTFMVDGIENQISIYPSLRIKIHTEKKEKNTPENPTWIQVFKEHLILSYENKPFKYNVPHWACKFLSWANVHNTIPNNNTMRHNSHEEGTQCTDFHSHTTTTGSQIWAMCRPVSYVYTLAQKQPPRERGTWYNNRQRNSTCSDLKPWSWIELSIAVLAWTAGINKGM